MNRQLEQIMFQGLIDHKARESQKVTGDNNLPGTNKRSFFQILPAMTHGSLLLMLIIIELMTLPEEFQVVLTFFQAFVLTLAVLRGLFQFVPMQIWEMPLRKLIYLEDG